MSQKLENQYNRLVALRNQARAARQALVDRAAREGRSDLSESESRAFERLTRDLDGADGDEGLEARVGHIAEELRRSRGDAETQKVLRATANATGGAAVADVGGVPPLNFDQDQLRMAHAALASRQTYRMHVEQRAFGTIDPSVPPALAPNIVGPIYEQRLLGRLPIALTDSPFVRYIRHYGTTGAAAIVGEGQPKPELVPQTDEVTIEMAKLAAHVGTSWESVRDFDTWQQYLTQNLAREIYNAENAQLLTGSGTGANITGFTSVSGILTHVAGAGTTPLSALDDIELSIATMRTGDALAEPDIFVVHPTTWSAIRRSKDLYGRYQVAPDPTADEARSVWGVPALVTTQFPAGDGLLIDTGKFGRVYYREGLSLLMGYSGNDFTSNIVRFVAEERFNLAVERPSAICHITGLPEA
ncbi:MAG: phage major capsid protein [Mycobacterium pseudokansasii]|uniref:phage major capsid protein n=1 Tax=Mycobacterium pseudokansasii TaxID=2341080 RepID=UPI0023F57BE4|nr:phage major capsid protein [Mycobacterium pseudokansasii]MBY0388960.1 phage major capsid protein [Mycobacterium pseudokansasii]